jgi:hypothetical protein
VPTVAVDSAEEVIVSAVGVATIVSDVDVVWAGLPLSVTVVVKVADPLVVDVPEIAPFDARLSPAGSLPDVIDQA